MTSFATVYNRFLGRITDDLYVQLTPEDTLKDLSNLLKSSIDQFEFPRKNLDDFVEQVQAVRSEDVKGDDFVISSEEGTSIIDNSYFTEDLSSEEIDILSYLMMDGWLQRQITSIENTRMKYSGSDFKFTSQANHLQKLITAQDKNYQRQFHLQRLYKRRKKDSKGVFKSTWRIFGKSALDEQ